MSDNKYLNLSGLTTLLGKLKETFASAAQGQHADTAYTHAQSSHAPSNAERNVIVGVQKNGADLTPNSSRKVNVIVPTKVSELTNDSGYKTSDTNTTYSISKSGNTITLEGSDGSSTSVTDSNTTYNVASTSANGLMSSADKTKLDGISTGANKTTVDSALSSSSTNPVQNKIINSALSGKVPTSRTVNGKALSGNITLSASDVGAIPASQKGTAYGVAELDSSGKVPSTQLPSFVDDVIEGYLSSGKFYKESAHTNEITAESGKIYVDLSTNKTYRWSGSAYTEISASLALGETSSTAYRGDRGKIAYDHSQKAHAPSNAEANVQSDWSVSDTGSDAYIKNKPTSLPANGGNASTVNGHSVQSDVPANAVFTDTKPVTMKGATSSAAGSAGYVPAPSAGASTRYLRSDGTWAVPPDTNTTYTLSSFGITATAAELNKLDGVTATATEINYVDGVTSNIQTQLNGKASTSHSHSEASDDTSGFMSSEDKTKLDGIATGANKYTHPVYTAKSSGLYKVTVDSTGHVSATTAVTKSDITALGIPSSDTNTWTALKGATTSAAGTAGYAPAPSAGAANRYLRSDGTWSVPPDTNTTYANMTAATASAAGKAGLVPAPGAGKQTAFLRGDGTWVVPTNTTYSTGTSSVSGITKLYTGTGTATDGSMTQNAITSALNGKAASSHTHNYAGSSSAGGSATSAVKLDTSTAGSATQPVYFSSGKPVACTYTLAKSVPSNAVFTDTNTWIALKGATSDADGTAGYAPAPSKGASNRYLRSDGTWAVPPDTNTTYSNMTAATSSAAGKAGLVPAPAAGAQTKYLRGDGTWQTPPNTTYSAATTSAAGLMSAADKTKLNGIATGANNYTLPTASSSTLGGVKTTSTVTSTSGLTACPIISGVPYYKDTNTTYSLSSFGITATAAELNKLDGVTATAAELNYVDGVTSNIQTQLNGKAASNHTHSGYAARSHNHSASNITSGTLPLTRGGTGGTTAASARLSLGAVNVICQASEPSSQNVGDIWFQEL